MTVFRRIVELAALVLLSQSVRAEYLKIELKVLGLDCELCARGVSASIGRLLGVESVNIILKTGLVKITLKSGNTLKMSDLRKRIRENGFRSTRATVTAIGQFQGSKFEVLGSGDSYDLGNRGTNENKAIQIDFDVP